MQTVSDLIIENIKNLPMWIKQVIAAELSTDLSKKLSDFNDLVRSDLLFQYLTPKTSVKGKQELEKRSMHLSDGYYAFLSDSENGKSTIFEITLKNNWSLSDAAKIFIRLYELEFIVVPNQSNNTNLYIAAFIASKIRTGEFLKKIGRIDAVQLEQALRYQKQLNEEGHHIKMASILIKMGYITDKGLDSLLLLKEEAKRRMPLNIGLASMQIEDKNEENDQIARLQKEISRLENENLIMKKHLKKLLNM